MGYYTRYQIDIVPNNEEIRQKFIDSTGFIEDDASKWYECDQDCRDISGDNPGYLIVVTGKGSESGDVWKSAFTNGVKVWEWKLNLAIPDVPQEIKDEALAEFKVIQKSSIEAKIKQLEEESSKLRQILDEE